MDHDAICDCPFRPRCATFNDPLIDEARKAPQGLGCREQSDVYRGKHCRTFACSYLSAVVSEVLGRPLDERPRAAPDRIR